MPYPLFAHSCLDRGSADITRRWQRIGRGDTSDCGRSGAVGRLDRINDLYVIRRRLRNFAAGGRGKL